MGDSDDTYDFSDIGPFIEGLRKGSDMVVGTRLKGKILPGAMPPLHRYLGTPVIAWLLNLFFRPASPTRTAACADSRKRRSGR